MIIRFMHCIQLLCCLFAKIPEFLLEDLGPIQFSGSTSNEPNQDILELYSCEVRRAKSIRNFPPVSDQPGITIVDRGFDSDNGLHMG